MPVVCANEREPSLLASAPAPANFIGFAVACAARTSRKTKSRSSESLRPTKENTNGGKDEVAAVAGRSTVEFSSTTS